MRNEELKAWIDKHVDLAIQRYIDKRFSADIKICGAPRGIQVYVGIEEIAKCLELPLIVIPGHGEPKREDRYILQYKGIEIMQLGTTEETREAEKK